MVDEPKRQEKISVASHPIPCYNLYQTNKEKRTQETMTQREQLIEFYIKEYTEANRTRKVPGAKTKGYAERVTAVVRTLKRAKGTRMTREVLENYHRQVHNLYYGAVHYHNKAIQNRLKHEVVPELVRLDLSMLTGQEQKMLGEGILFWLETEMPGEICRQSLFDLFHTYEQQVVRAKILDLVPSRPEMEFPDALNMQRHFVLHIGPTNSGKTFQALERLKEARYGIYLGPLRLLALEVYERMMELGVPCTMLTGQECIREENSRVTASTIEMANFYRYHDVAVIDEAQMTADPDRGHCWTKAILGLLADEIHVCMSPVAEPVVRHLIELCGDDYEIHRYERKTALVCEEESFSFPEDVQEGDALVVFSKKSVLDVAGRLEEQGIETSVIYGSLPPEIRRRQMQLFTSGQTKVVVATDAIGMGLNLPVRRIVFIQTEKFDGTKRRGLSAQEIKQIAGRAGRFGIYDTGYVNAMGPVSLDYVRERLDVEEKPIEKVSLGFPQILLGMEEPLDVILKIWHDQKAEPPFEKVSIDELLCLYGYAVRHKDYIMDFEDKNVLYQMISCPIDVKDREVVRQWLEYCRNYPADGCLEHPRKDGPGRRWERGADRRKMEMQRYETYYKKLDLYYQFSQRFDKRIDEEWLKQEREYTEGRIMQYLMKGKEGYIARCQYCGRLLPVGYPFPRCQRCFDRG